MYLVRSGAIVGYDSILTSLGINHVQLMREAGLEPAHFRDTNTYISIEKLTIFLEIASKKARFLALGLALAERQGASGLGDLPIRIAQEPSLEDALNRFNDLMFLHANGTRLDIERTGQTARLLVSFLFDSVLGKNQLIQLALGQTVNILNSLTGDQSTISGLYLRQPRPKTVASYSPQYLEKVQFRSDFDGIEIPCSILQSAPAIDEERVKLHFRDYFDQLQKRYPKSLEDQVREMISISMPLCEADIVNVASKLDMHPRTLQRELQSLNTTYSDILRKTRERIAKRYLTNENLSITEIALNLGYAEASTFSRYFKAWTGVSPNQWRRARSQPGVSEQVDHDRTQ